MDADHLSRRLLLSLIFALCIVVLNRTPLLFASCPPAPGPGLGLAPGQLNQAGKSHAIQAGPWVQSKLAHQVAPPGSGVITHAVPQARTLSTTYADQLWEPPAVGTDAAGHAYTDYYMGNLCGPGATNVVLDYWNNVNTRAVGGHSYRDPHSSTFWNDLHEHASMMRLGTQVRPPSYTSAGEMIYGTYPSAYTANRDATDALNWEASNHNSANWLTYFYLLVGPGGLTLNTLRNDISSDIGNYSVPAVVTVNDAYLPDWNGSPYRGGSHYVAVVGYDNKASVFTYVETCTTGACGTSRTGHYNISQQQLLNGIVNDNGNGALIW